MKLTLIENEGFQYLAYVWLKMAQRYLEPSALVRIVGPEGTYFESINIDEFYGNYEAKVQLESTVKRLQTDDIKRYQALYSSLAQNPLIDQTELTKTIMERVFELDKDEAERLMAPPAPGGSPMQGDMMAANPPVQGPQGAGMPPMGAGQPTTPPAMM